MSISPCPPPPVVFVNGFLGTHPAGELELFNDNHNNLNLNTRKNLNNNRLILCASVGAVSSIHDSARELFYCIGGGRVDYTEKHSKTCKHKQYGIIYDKPLYPIWDNDHPIHLIGYSLGNNTLLCIMI